MAQDITTRAAADHEALVAQVEALRKDLVHLAGSVQKGVTGNGKALAQEVGAGMTSTARFIGGKGHEADVAIERAIAANPYVALGLAAGVGLLLGALTRR